MFAPVLCGRWAVPYTRVALVPIPRLVAYFCEHAKGSLERVLQEYIRVHIRADTSRLKKAIGRYTRLSIRADTARLKKAVGRSTHLSIQTNE